MNEKKTGVLVPVKIRAVPSGEVPGGHGTHKEILLLNWCGKDRQRGTGERQECHRVLPCVLTFPVRFMSAETAGRTAQQSARLAL